MSLLLYRLGRTAYRRPWVFIGSWAVILAAVIGLVAMNGGRVSSNVTIDGTRSQQVLDDLRAELPATAGGQGSIVFTAPPGERLDAGARASAVGQAAKEIAALSTVVDRSADQGPANGQARQGQAPPASAQAPAPASASASAAASSSASAQASASAPYRPLVADGKPVPGVLVSPDGSVAMLQLQFTEQVEDLPEGTTEHVIAIAERDTHGQGLDVLPSESLEPMHPPVGGHEAFGLLVAAIVLLLTLGSLRAAGLPLLTALTGVGIGVGGAFALSSSITLTTATPVLALMVGLAVGMDYALFIVNRQRRLILTQGLPAGEAASRALGTAGSAVLFAGTTVVVALVGLTIIGISFLSVMALVAAATVVLAVLIALTLLPALLGLVGERICSTKARVKGARLAEQEHRGFAHRWASVVTGRPWRVVGAVVAALAVAAIPLASMSLGMPNGATANVDSTERRSYDAITRGFGEGFNGPLVVVARPAEPETTLDERALQSVTRALQNTPHVAGVSMTGASPDRSLAVFTVIPEEGPDDASTAVLVDALRDPALSAATAEGVTLGVTGLTAVNIDISAKLGDVLPVYVGIIVALSLVILLLVFRSVVIPLKATFGFLLTIASTFGLTTAVFQWGWVKELFGFDTAGPILSFLPIMVTGILYGLAMDYEVFLVSSMREAHVHGHRRTDAVVHGFDQAGRVVLAAAVIMVSVFAGFIFSTDPMIKQFGFALGVGVLVDALLVRMTLVPAVMALLGEHAWWLPRWLDRLLPDLDVEGDRLKTHLERESSGSRAELAAAASGSSKA